MKKFLVFILFFTFFIFSCKEVKFDYSYLVENVKNDNYRELSKASKDVLLDFKDEKGRNIIHYCAINNSYKTLNFLLSQTDFRKIINEKDRYGNSPLKLAILKGYLNIVKILIENGADIHLRDNFLGFTPIMTASFNSKKEIVLFLYSKGANIKDRDLKFNMSIPYWLVRKRDLDMLKFFLQDIGYREKDVEGLLLEACFVYNTSKETLEYLYNLYPLSIDYKDDEGINCLMACMISKNFYQADFIIKKNRKLSFQKDKCSQNFIDHFFVNVDEKDKNEEEKLVELLKRNFSDVEIKKILLSSEIYNSLDYTKKVEIFNKILGN